MDPVPVIVRALHRLMVISDTVAVVVARRIVMVLAEPDRNELIATVLLEHLELSTNGADLMARKLMDDIGAQIDEAIRSS